LEEVTPLEDTLPKKGPATSSSAKKRMSDQRGTLRSERLYQTHKEKQDKWVEKRKKLDYERHQECSFRPIHPPAPADQFERVYRFNVDSVLKKYQQVVLHQQVQVPAKVPDQPILLTAKQKAQYRRQEEIKEKARTRKADGQRKYEA
jgi:hypothetical protein